MIMVFIIIRQFDVYIEINKFDIYNFKIEFNFQLSHENNRLQK